MTTPVSRRMAEESGTEALRLLEGGAQGRLVFVRREHPVVRPAVRILPYGRLVGRTPVQAIALADRGTLTYHADEIRAAGGTGWTVTATGGAEVITDPDEVGRYRRTLPRPGARPARHPGPHPPADRDRVPPGPRRARPVSAQLEALPLRHVLTLPATGPAVGIARETTERVLTQWGIRGDADGRGKSIWTTLPL